MSLICLFFTGSTGVFILIKTISNNHGSAKNAADITDGDTLHE